MSEQAAQTPQEQCGPWLARLSEILERERQSPIQDPLADRAWLKARQWIDAAGARLLASGQGQAFVEESIEAGANPDASLGALMRWLASGEPPKKDWKRGHAKALRWACRRRDVALARLMALAAGEWAEKSTALEACAKDGWLQGVEALAPLLKSRVDSALLEGVLAEQAAAVALLAPMASEEGLAKALWRAGAWGSADCCAQLAPWASREVCERALLGAARGGYPQAARELARWAAPLAHPCEALTAAASKGCEESARAVLSISDPKADGSAALRAAARHGNDVLVEMLLPLSEANARGSEALREAASQKQASCVKLLLPHCDVNGADAQGSTALHKALCWEASEEVLRLLLGAGAQMLPDRQGRFPIDMARWHGQKSNQNLLLKVVAEREALELAQSLAPSAVKARPAAL